jgi:soluble lytic murein transglycosylase-like protein
MRSGGIGVASEHTPDGKDAMETVRELWRQLARRLEWLAGDRRRLMAIAAALCLLGVTGTLVMLSLPRPTQQRGAGNAARAALAGNESTAALISPSATATLAPKPAPTHSTVHAPQPPPIPFKPKPTPTPTPRPPTATPAGTPSGTPTSTPLPTATPTPCGPGAYQGGNPTQDQLRAALQSAANTYGLPVNMLYAVAWQESRWHQDVVACDGGIGLMQIQPDTAPWLNQQSVPVCGLPATSYDVHQYQGNALLGAKFLKWLSCFYSYWGDNGGTSVASPGTYTVAWYYHQAQLRYPDTLNADGSANPNSLCVKVYNSSPENPALPSTTSDPWACPFDPLDHPASNPNPGAIHNPDNTLLDVTLSAYNEGPGNVSSCGICNPSYVTGVEGYVPQFQAGTLPQPS